MVTTSDLERDAELIKSAAVAAGIIATGFFRAEFRSWSKPNASPVTEADIEVDDYLHEVLLEARPDYGWVSEESGEEGRLTKPRVFVVDPIDGTRAFQRGDEGWAISIAVVEEGTPVAGVVYSPARDELYEAVLGGGAKLNGAPLALDPPVALPPVIPAPGPVHRELNAAGLDYERGEAVSSLACRLMQVAAGRVAAAAAKRGAHDWDIAAAALILAESGASLEDACAGPPVFNRETMQHGALLATRDAALGAVLRKALKAVYGCPAEDGIGTISGSGTP